MNIEEHRKAKELERAAISRKFAAGQSFEEHAREVSGFDLDVIRQARVIIKGPDNDQIVLEPKSS